MSDHKHVFTYAPRGKLHDQPNATLVCDCGVGILEAYHYACEERDRYKAQLEGWRVTAHAMLNMEYTERKRLLDMTVFSSKRLEGK